MDNLEFYRQNIETILRKYVDIPYTNGAIEQYLIIDPDRNHFMLFDVGWQQQRRVHGCITSPSPPTPLATDSEISV
jgi:hypothetical protein